MKLFRIIIVSFLTLITLAGGLFYGTTARAGSDDDSYRPKRILFISSYNYAFMTVPDQIEGFSDGLEGLTVDISYEFMDSKTYFHAGDIEQFHDYLKYKLTTVSKVFDLVVLGDDTALHFGMNYGTELFPDTPVVFLCVNNLTDAETAAARPNVTGIAEVVDYPSNITLFSKLFPKRNHFVVVLDNSNSAQGEFVEFEKFAEETGCQYDVINTSYYSRQGLIDAFSQIDDTSTVLFLDFLSDGEGNLYTPETSSKLLSDNAPSTPICRVTSADIGYGVLGGVSYSFYDAGFTAGKMAAKILTGENPDDLPIATDAMTETYFDQDAMDRFHLTKSQLPEDSIIINEHQTLLLFYQQHRTIMNLIFLVILMMIAIIIILTLFTRKQHQLIHEDFMTKIPNRTYITSRLKQTIDDAKPFGLIMMDVDHFKSINDTLGHLIGDELLIEVARRLKQLPKDGVIFARIGGDEFMGFLIDPSIEKTDNLCQEIVRVMHEDFELSCGVVNITTSIGAALYPVHTDKPEMVQGLADKALYDVKERGRDGYEIYDPKTTLP